jgi:hypothetical protein
MLTVVRRRAALACAVLLLIVVVVAGTTPRAAAQATPAIVYRPPVDAPVYDPFRAPGTPYGPGHRGIEYDTAPDTPVAVAAPGTVVFAGDVAGVPWVTVRHADDVRTTYGPLATIAVQVGQVLASGDVVGTTAGRLLFTARVGDNYIDPASLLSAADDVHLVPEPASLPSFSPASFGIGDVLSPDAVLNALAWGGNRATEKVEAVYGVTPMPFVLHTVDALAAWRERQSHCTAPEAAAPSPSNRHLAVLVGGLGSTSTGAAIDDVDTTALGYDPGDVVRFSYRGGRVPTTRPVTRELAQLEVTSYAATDTAGDLDEAGARLADLLSAVVAAAPPNAAVDVYAHSQGGLVLRLALDDLARRDPASVRRIGVVVTLATPHHGAQLAGFVEAAAAPPLGPQTVDTAGALAGTDLRVEDPAIRELAPGSGLLRHLSTETLPTGPAYVSIAAQGDPVVPSPDAQLDGAANVIVPVTGLGAHADLPGSAPATREMALALAGLPPSCETATDAVLDSIWGDLYHNGEQFLTAAETP